MRHDTTPRKVGGSFLFRGWLPATLKASVLFRVPGGAVQELTVLVLTRGAWERRPESRDRKWAAVPFGLWVIGLHLET